MLGYHQFWKPPYRCVPLCVPPGWVHQVAECLSSHVRKSFGPEGKAESLSAGDPGFGIQWMVDVLRLEKVDF